MRIIIQFVAEAFFMKKGSKLLATVFLAGGSAALLIAAFTASDTSFRLFAVAPNPRPDAMNCNYYWQEVKYGFNDIYKIVSSKIITSSSSVIPGEQKEIDVYTWGTITATWLDDSNQPCMIIQSTNSSQIHGAIQLTNCVDSLANYSIGNVVEVKYYPSSVTLGIGKLPQISKFSQQNYQTVVTVAYETNPWPVISQDASRDFTAGRFSDIQLHGLLKSHVEKVAVTSIDTKACQATIDGDTYHFIADYSGLNEHLTQDIYEQLDHVMTNGSRIHLGGYMFAYDDGRDTQELRLLIRDLHDIDA